MFWWHEIVAKRDLFGAATAHAFIDERGMDYSKMLAQLSATRVKAVNKMEILNEGPFFIRFSRVNAVNETEILN